MRIATQAAQMVTTESAIARARKAWRGEAAVIRHDLRERGTHGPLDVLDTAAGGRGYKAAPTQLARFAVEMRDAGCTRAEVQERLHHVADLIVALVFTDGAA